MWLGSYEYEKESKYATCLSRGDIVYDLGSHAGLYTLLAAKHIGPSGRVYAIEPFPNNCANLRHNVRINSFSNVTIE